MLHLQRRSASPLLRIAIACGEGWGSGLMSSDLVGERPALAVPHLQRRSALPLFPDNVGSEGAQQHMLPCWIQ